MGLFKKLFRSEEESEITTYADFWKWFALHHRSFHQMVSSMDRATIEEQFFRQIAPRLHDLNHGIFYLTGMLGDSIAELVLTADGNPKSVVYVEELVDAAPELDGWRFTKLKQPSPGIGVHMHGQIFDAETLSFYPNESESLPDLIDITLVHAAFDGDDDNGLKNGAFIFLENLIGELNLLTIVDQVQFATPAGAEKEIIPIDALPNFLETRQSLFAEKHDGVRIFTENDSYSLLEATLENGNKLLATVNTDLLRWERKASHPWMLVVTVKYDPEELMGLPTSQTGEKLEEIEDFITQSLKDADGYLNIGRQSANGERNIFFACVDFREPSKVLDRTIEKFPEWSISYDIFKDKYWESVEMFNPER